MRAFLLYIDDWLSSKKIERMDAFEERGYLRLLLRAATEPDCGLPDNDAELAIYSKLGDQWYRQSKDKTFRLDGKTSGQKLRECFFMKDGRLFNERLLKEFEHQKEVQAKRAEAGRKGGRPKANENQLVSLEESKRLSKSKANGKQNETNDVCVWASSSEETLEVKNDESEFDYEAGFHEAWNLYPKRGRTKIEDSKRIYVERTSPDPFVIHEKLTSPLRPEGKWSRSDLWKRGYVSAFYEYLRNSRWLEDPEPYNHESQQNGAIAAVDSVPRYIPPKGAVS